MNIISIQLLLTIILSVSSNPLSSGINTLEKRAVSNAILFKREPKKRGRKMKGMKQKRGGKK
jgi:hypothetical protein